jgi:hypothetical protein
MNEEQQLSIHFNNGTRMEVAFPKQIKNSMGAVMEAMKRILESDKLCVEAEGRLVVIPWTSVQHVEVTPVPSALPFGAIKGAQILQSDRPTQSEP